MTIALSRVGESMLCPKCQRGYDLIGRQPRCYMPCGHTVCQLCAQRDRAEQCQVCRRRCSQTIPDYGMMDMVRELVAKGQRKSAFEMPEKMDKLCELCKVPCFLMKRTLFVFECFIDEI